MLERLPEFLASHPILTGALAAVVALILYTEISRLTRKYGQLSPAEAVRIVNQDDSLVLDVREDAELKSGKIAGARHIALGSLKKRMPDLEAFRDKPVLVYCRSGARSGSAASQLSAAGFTQVHNLAGGIQAWTAAGLPVKTR